MLDVPGGFFLTWFKCCMRYYLGMYSLQMFTLVVIILFASKVPATFQSYNLIILCALKDDQTFGGCHILAARLIPEIRLVSIIRAIAL